MPWRAPLRTRKVESPLPSARVRRPQPCATLRKAPRSERNRPLSPAGARFLLPIAANGSSRKPRRGGKMLQVLALLTVLLSAVDHWTTYLCLRAPHQGWEVTEANPIADWLFSSLGLVPGLLIDSFVTLAAVAFLLGTRRLSKLGSCASSGSSRRGPATPWSTTCRPFRAWVCRFWVRARRDDAAFRTIALACVTVAGLSCAVPAPRPLPAVSAPPPSVATPAGRGRRRARGRHSGAHGIAPTHRNDAARDHEARAHDRRGIAAPRGGSRAGARGDPRREPLPRLRGLSRRRHWG